MVWGGTGRTGRGSRPPSLGGHSSGEPPQTPQIEGGFGSTIHGGEGGPKAMKPPKNPLPRCGTTRGGGAKHPKRAPPVPPQCQTPPPSTDPAWGGGAAVGNVGRGGPSAGGDNIWGPSTEGVPVRDWGVSQCWGGAINGSQHLGGGQSQCWKHSQFGGLGRTGKGGFPVLENGEGVPVLERGGGGGTSPQGGGWGSK